MKSGDLVVNRERFTFKTWCYHNDRWQITDIDATINFVAIFLMRTKIVTSGDVFDGALILTSDCALLWVRLAFLESILT